MWQEGKEQPQMATAALALANRALSPAVLPQSLGNEWDITHGP